MTINTVLLTTDFSDTSRAAFDPAIDLARKYGAKIIVTHVESDRYLRMVGDHAAIGLDPEYVWRAQRENAEARLNELVDANLPGMVAQREIRQGAPPDEIVRSAREHHADVIVMATHGRGFISHALMGSTTERVIRSAPCPVLAINVAARGNGRQTAAAG